MSEDSIREVSEQSEPEISPKHLRELIFIACDRLQSTGKKISRPLIRSQVGKISNRDLDKYINEWKESKESQSLVHGSINQDAIIETIPGEAQNINQNINLNRHSQREQITQMGVKLASEMLIGESIVASYLLQNPDKLPQEFQKQIQQARAQLDATINQVFRLDADLEEIVQSAIATLQIGE